MKIAEKIVVITGAASGIGAAMAKRFCLDGAKAVIISDRDEARVVQQEKLIRDASGANGDVRAMQCDVAVFDDIKRLVDFTIQQYGRIDLFCSNAGIIVSGDQASPTSDWQRAWDVNVMAHVYAANAVLPAMLARGEGYFLNTCSAASMLTSLGAAPYAVSKHGALAFAEWLAITYGKRGIKVSALCPQVVRTKMIEDAINNGAGDAVTSGGLLIEPDNVAELVIDGLDKEKFLILTHEDTQKFAEGRIANVERWIAGMQKLAAK
tara:strand:- start:434 stop:1228 length:795 start_codon:yes stop_codon:yes gene_type:complete